MVEFYPVIFNNSITELVASYGEFTCISSPDLKQFKLFLWFNDYAIDVTEIFKKWNGVIKFDNYVLDISQWFETIVYSIFQTFENLDNYIQLLRDVLGKVIEGKSIILSLSGGKDSTAALITLLKLQEYVNFRLYVCYTYMPFLENIETLKFIDYVHEKLGIEIEILSPPKNIVVKYLKKFGLPYRRSRWCTYLKVRPLREFMKKHNIQFRVVGDRFTECEKRWKRLLLHVLKQEFYSKKEIRPTFTFTLIDVVKLCKMYNLVNPQYLQGFSRVSCVFCPYKTLYELKLEKIDNVEDPGFIESIIKQTYSKWYKNVCELNEFIDYNLWRYVPNVAKMFIKFRNYIRNCKEVNFENKISIQEISQKYSSLWTSELPKIKVISINEIDKSIIRINLRELFIQKREELTIPV